MKQLSAAIFDWHEPDRVAAQAMLQSRVDSGQMTPEDMQRRMSSSSFWNDNCRRVIPAADVLLARLNAVFEKFDGDKGTDPRMGQLFSAETHSVHKRTQALVEKGFLSGMSSNLYYSVVLYVMFALL